MNNLPTYELARTMAKDKPAAELCCFALAQRSVPHINPNPWRSLVTEENASLISLLFWPSDEYYFHLMEAYKKLLEKDREDMKNSIKNFYIFDKLAEKTGIGYIKISHTIALCIEKFKKEKGDYE